MESYRSSDGFVRPEATPAAGPEDVAEVVEYLRVRGLAPDDEDAGHLLLRLLELPGRESSRRVSVRRAADSLYVSRRTLGRRCRAAGLPHPSQILCFGRVLNSVRLLKLTGWTLHKVANATGWPDQFTLSNAMHRLTGMRPTEARTRGILYLAEAWLQREAEAGRATLREPAPPACPSCGQAMEVPGKVLAVAERRAAHVRRT